MTVQVGNTQMGAVGDTAVDPVTERGSPSAAQAIEDEPPAPPKIVRARLIQKTRAKPEYTPAARRQGKEGVVVVRVHIDEKGRVTKVVVKSGLGFGLDEATVNAVKKWRYKPKTIDGRAVASKRTERVGCSQGLMIRAPLAYPGTMPRMTILNRWMIDFRCDPTSIHNSRLIRPRTGREICGRTFDVRRKRAVRLVSMSDFIHQDHSVFLCCVGWLACCSRTGKNWSVDTAGESPKATGVLTRAPEILTETQAVYPPDLYESGITGTVGLRITIDENGDVADVVMDSSSDSRAR